MNETTKPTARVLAERFLHWRQARLAREVLADLNGDGEAPTGEVDAYYKWSGLELIAGA